MADWLILRLARDPAQPLSWAAVDARGQLLSAVATGPIDDVAPAAAGHRVCALVPGADVLQTAADLPAKSSAKLQQVVGYALEDQVAADVDLLHFAIGKSTGTGAFAAKTPVDVVSNATMREWLDTLAAAGVSAESMHADSALVPMVPGHITAMIEADTIVIRTESQRAVTLPADDIAGAFASAFGNAASEEEIGTQHVIVYVTPPDWQRYSTEVEALRPRVATLKVQLLSGGVLPLLAQQFGDAGAINLLQGAYAPKRRGGGSLRAWRLAAVLAAAFVGLHLLGKFIDLQRLGKISAGLDASIEQTFRMAMPGEQSAVDARRRMETRLAGLVAGRSEQGGLLTLLAAVADARSAAPSARFEALSFRSGELDMKLSAPDAESLEKINQALRSSGIAADLTSGSSRGGSYEGRVKIRAQGG